MTTFASDPATAQPPIKPLDLTKHVNYTLGMVLGVDDFDQEFAYLSGHDRWLARDLSGYGTVWGLGVRLELDGSGGPRVNVAPGAAVTPCGRLVCVSPAQCAGINEWLAANEAEAREQLLSSPPAGLRLYVVLCHRECPTDNLPIPGEPCRSEDRLTAPSRLKDDFRLELRSTPPAQREEDAIRDFVAWLRAIPVVDGPGSDLDELLAAIRTAAMAAVATLESPPSSPPGFPYDFVLGSPPVGLAIPASQSSEYLRAAFSLWVTELRSALRNALPGCECGCEGTGSCGCGCHSGSGGPEEPCDDDVVLLAALDVPVVPTVGGDIEAADSGWEVDERRRPYVLHTRFLQEWLLTEALCPEEGSPPLGSPPDLLNPISIISAHSVTGDPTADWDPDTGALDLGIPAGEGIDEVKVAPKPAGHVPNVESFADGVLTLGLGPGAKGTTGDPGTSFIVAAGRFKQFGATVWAFGGLDATKVPGHPIYHLRLDRFNDTLKDPRLTLQFMVKGTAWTGFEGPSHTVERLDSTDGDLKGIVEEAFKGLPDDDKRPTVENGILVRVVNIDKSLAALGFEIEISAFETEPVNEDDVPEDRP